MKRKLVLVALLVAVTLGAMAVLEGCTGKKTLGPLGGLSEGTPTPLPALIPTSTSSPIPAQPTEVPTEVVSAPAPSPTSQALPTPTVEPPTQAACVPQAAFVMDITVPDGTTFMPGKSFDKVWRFMNTGDCPWPEGTMLTFVSGDKLGAPDQAPAGAPQPGATTDVSVNMVAPEEPGTYKGTWRLVTPDGVSFGPEVYVKIVVKSPSPTATEQPAATATPTPVPTQACASNPDPMFDDVMNFAALAEMHLGCPQGGVTHVPGAFQKFWSDVENPNPHMHLPGIMIWRKDLKKIYVMSRYSDTQRYGNFEIYDDLWHEGLPEVPPACAGLTPPPGYQIPIRGFGKVWCDNDLKDVIGWPNQKETGVMLDIQVMDNGLLIRTSNGYRIALEISTHRWTYRQ